MTPHYQTDEVTVYHSDCVEVMAELADDSIDAAVTDPPYNLSFMSREWDSHATPLEFQQWCQVWASECLRVLKPGGHMLAFGGTRTFHRLACAVEDAGFEIRDSIAWIYGSGFPKSLNVSKAIDRVAGELEPEGVGFTVAAGYSHMPDKLLHTAPAAGYKPPDPVTVAAKLWQGWGTALKPAFEPVIVARKPLCGTVAENVQRWGTGAINVDACRVGDELRKTTRSGGVVVSQNRSMSGPNYSRVPGPVVAGRWPPNVVLDEAAAAELDQQSGNIKGQIGMRSRTPVQFGVGCQYATQSFTQGVADDGGASRFFPVFKYTPKAPQTERPSVDGVAHPTCKPLELMRWLVRLVTPPHGVVLDPFAGTGTTAEACIHEYRHAIVIERETDYLPLIVARLHKPMQVGFDFES